MSGFFIFKKKIYLKNRKFLFNRGYKILLDLIYSSKENLKILIPSFLSLMKIFFYPENIFLKGIAGLKKSCTFAPAKTMSDYKTRFESEQN